jgi:TPR repeat protein
VSKNAAVLAAVQAKTQFAEGARKFDGDGTANSIDQPRGLECFRKAAASGYAPAAAWLARCYHRGMGGVKEDPEEAAGWAAKAVGPLGLRALADAGDPAAQHALSSMHLAGRGVPQSMEQAIAWSKKAAASGHADAQFSLGLRCNAGDGGSKEIDGEPASSWFRKAADQGHADAQFSLAALFIEGGGGLGKNEKEAMEWFGKAAAQGDPSGHKQFTLGTMYLGGGGVGVTRDEKKAMKWFKKAAAKEGKAAVNAQCNLGAMCAHGIGTPDGKPDPAAAAEWLQMAVDSGSAAAMYRMGSVLLEEGANHDPAGALALFRRASDLGNADAQLGLAACYMGGVGVEKDEATAVLFFTQAAEQGDVNAQTNLAGMHLNGRGCEVDEQKAFEWFLKAAQGGSPAAQYSIGGMFLTGRGVVKDQGQAQAWYQQAAQTAGEQGNAEIAQHSQRMLQQFAAAQAAAQAQAGPLVG